MIARAPARGAPRRPGGARAALALSIALAASPIASSAAGHETAGRASGTQASASMRASGAAGAGLTVPRGESPVPSGLGVPAIAAVRMDDTFVVGANDLARLIGASREWRSEVKKLVLKLGEHRLTFTDGNPFVIADDRMLRLDHPVRARAGELQVPVELARALPAGEGWPRLGYDPAARELRAAPAAGFVGPPSVIVRGGVTELVLPAEHPEAASVVGSSRARFRLRLAGGLLGPLPDSLPDDGLLRDVAASASPGGVTLELTVDPAATGWRLERESAGADAEPGRTRLVLARGIAGLEAFAPEGAPGPRVLRTVVLDPGHGGADAGVRVEGAVEKSLALDLARAVADELHRRSTVRVVLTRFDDRDLAQESRAETANRAQADAVLSLHFSAGAAGGAGASAEGGATPSGGAATLAAGDVPASGIVHERLGAIAWCPPAAPGRGAASAGTPGAPELLPWRDAALPRAVESRGLAESVTSALERQGFGPTSVRERLPFALIGVESPGVLLDLGSLADKEERTKLLSPDGVRRLAAAIADGLLNWQGE